MARKSRKKGTGIVEGNIDAARYVTVHKHRKLDEYGHTIGVERRLEALPEEPELQIQTYEDLRHRGQSVEQHQIDEWGHNDNPGDTAFTHDDLVTTTGKKRQRDYILQFVNRVDEFLGVLLTREARPSDETTCNHCKTGSIAIWRCDDCSLGHTMCRKCMRITHSDDPFHKIRRWNGKHFASAELWQVGVHIFVPHYSGTRICEILNLQKVQLEREETVKDNAEQQELRRHVANTTRPNNGEIDEHGDVDGGEVDGNGEVQGEDFSEPDQPRINAQQSVESDAIADQRFFAYLDNIRSNSDIEPPEEPDDDAEVGDAEGEGDVEILPGTTGMSDQDDSSFYALQNSTRVVHSNGIHNLPLVTCSCRGMEQIPADLIACRLLPTSFVRIRTVFTAQVLDKFRLCNLELQSSAYQFYQLVRRLTKPMDPSSVVNLYNEFRRMTRLWRWMKKLKWAGFAGHNGKAVKDVCKGELANFCPACPQPGINLPDGWENDPNKFVYRRVLVADGNFKADHVQPKKQSNDIWLSEGGGMIPKREEYHSFLKTAIEKLTGAPCENTFRAITGAMLASKSCDVTGVVGVACARHGCYAPNALVDLFKGEQQKNVDFALLTALKSTGVDPRQGAMIIYDVICQFIIHLKTRIGHLLPEGLDIDRAIGLFHVHAHKDDCLFRYSPAFIPGAARVIGEILESLWGKMNHVSPASRTATLAHRAEMLDDHASDSNHSKALALPKDLCRRYVEAVETRDCAEKYFAEVSRVAPQDVVELWTRQIVDAEARRLISPKVMDIYAAKGRGQEVTDTTETTETTSNDPIEAYIQFALMVEEKQIEIRLCVRQLTKSPRHADPQKLQSLREKLQPLISELERLQECAGVLEHSQTQPDTSVEMLDWADEITDDDVVIPPPQPTQPLQPIEEHKIFLPSHYNVDQRWAPVELKARISQANSHLNQIRNLIAEKSFQYSDVIRNAPRKGVRTRSRARIDEMNHRLTFYSQLYTECRTRLINLGADSSILAKFQKLSKDDVKTSTAILDPNKPGSTRIRLSWIWHNSSNQRLGPNIIAENGEIRPADPEGSHINVEETDPETLTEFKRVHWLRARAQFHRWREEAIMLDYEMQWTVRYFSKKEEWWKNSAVVALADDPAGDNIVNAGRAAYADRQSSIWGEMARRADYLFHMTNPSYKKI
ncbi:hypothetical protein JR316_0004116 [Psilocybe cubensis]|uniref:CxC2-like cysteine cluster KDZ transposase-associated domain-containing protein n=2 Tax=Psilocybe cubensis TaxID=181762 RepID=A0A8H7Y6Y1_PSICU|nr:hypothetical protein JR316_0004116 [Psilocybe cubensis]KAH9484634.1 hypothetical protein JR316_0004116 [Psilocybe cubensis]